MTLSEKNATRFTGRVESYQTSRPGYPPEILDLLRLECGLTPQLVIVDVAAGTGLLAGIFLENGNRVMAVEPNAEMRSACTQLQSRYPRLTVFDGTAENSGLPHACANFITVGQAIHWFDLPRARKEFARVLDDDGWCVLAYNERRPGGDPFHDGYEDLLLRFGVDYDAVRLRYLTESRLRAFFDPSPMRQHHFKHSQLLDRNMLVGRIASSSYMPIEGRPGYAGMLKAIDLLFAKNEKNGFVQIDYDCGVSYGQLNG